MKLRKDLYFCLNFLIFFVWPSDALLGCKEHRLKLVQLLTMLCNSTQPTLPARDACSGCFVPAASFEPGPRQLLALSQCATLYLTASGYQLCAANLAVSWTFLVGPFHSVRLSSLAGRSFGYQAGESLPQTDTVHTWLLRIRSMRSPNECRHFGKAK